MNLRLSKKTVDMQRSGDSDGALQDRFYGVSTV